MLFGETRTRGARRSPGNPFADQPTGYALYGSPRKQRRVELRWNLFPPPGTPTGTRQQYEENWVFGDYQLFDFATRRDIVDHASTQDYLLVTALPRLGTGFQRLISFAGLHGPGQAGAMEWLRAPDPDDLVAIERKSGGSPDFQALFEVSAGRGGAATVSLFDACALEV